MKTKKLVITLGASASGKTTFVDRYMFKNADKTIINFNRDNFRNTLFNTTGKGVLDHDNEKAITKIVTEQTVRLFKSNLADEIIWSDTNISKLSWQNIEKVIYELNIEHNINVELKVVPFFLSKGKLLRNNKTRTRLEQVDEKVILRQYSLLKKNHKWIYKKIDEINQQIFVLRRNKTAKTSLLHAILFNNRKPAIIVDLDGTISLFKEKGHRTAFEQHLCDQDQVNMNLKKIINHLEIDYHLIFLSGRSDKYKKQTIDFLKQHNLSTSNLFMRSEGDTRRDSVVKAELYLKHVIDRYDVKLVFDDRNQVVNMWRNYFGLTVYQVAEGDF